MPARAGNLTGSQVVLVFPAQLHEGDRFTDAAGDEWEVASRPVTYKQGA